MKNVSATTSSYRSRQQDRMKMRRIIKSETSQILKPYITELLFIPLTTLPIKESYLLIRVNLPILLTLHIL